MAIKEYKTNEKGVVKCVTEKGKVYYRGRARINKKLYYTNTDIKYKTVKSAKEARDKLIEDINNSIASGNSTPSSRLKKTYLVKDVLKEYKSIVETVKPGLTYSRNTLNERKRQLGQMIDSDYYCCIRDLPVKYLTNDKLAELKYSYYMIRNTFGKRYKIDTIRRYLTTFKLAFEDTGIKNPLVREKSSSLYWEILNVNKAEQNSPTQLVILDKEKTAINNKLQIGDKTIDIKGKNKKESVKKRKNDADHWTNRDFTRFNKTYKNILFGLEKEIEQKHKVDIKYSDYQLSVLFMIAYFTGMRFGEIRAMVKNNLYIENNTHLYRLEHAIPSNMREDYKKLIEDEEVWNTVCVPKGREARPVIIENYLYSVIKKYLEILDITKNNNEYGFLFYNISSSIIDKKKEKFFEKYKLTKIKFHDFRHSTAYRNKVEKKIPSAEVAIVLGHKDGGKLVDKTYAPLQYEENKDKLIEIEKNNKLNINED